MTALKAFSSSSHRSYLSYSDKRKLQSLQSSLDAYSKTLWNGPVKGQPYTIPGIGIKLVYVAPGTFQMGYYGFWTRFSGYGYNGGAKPVHRVTISKGYWIGKYEVTQSEYQSITGTNPSYFKGSDKPVEKVSWNDAVKFCEKLTARERRAGRLASGREYRLPTEAEWEFAARGGTKSRGYKYSGSDNIDSVAWYTSNSGSRTHEVGTKSANELGIHDMSGNVWEWCRDWYGKYSSTGVTDPTGASSGSNRVIRGGGWDDIARGCRSAFRYWFRPSDRNNGLGFRLLRTVPENNERQ